jgi:hypothetical protein
MKRLLYWIFALWVGVSSAEDAVFGGVHRHVIGASLCVMLASAAMRVNSLWYCIPPLCCFFCAEKITRLVVQRSRKNYTHAQPLPCVLGTADIFAIGIIALFTGTLWAASAIIASFLCGMYCVITKKRRAAFIPFLNAGVVVCLALENAGIIFGRGGLLHV